jgi:transcription factor WhiB
MSWWARAACRGYPPSYFHREQGSRRGEPDAWAEWAKSICATCPVVRECLALAYSYEDTPLRFRRLSKGDKLQEWTDTPLPQGVWGGTTPSERHAHHIKHLESCPGRCRGCRPIEGRIDLLTNKREESAA